MKIYQNNLFSTKTHKLGQIEKPSKIAKDMLKFCCVCGCKTSAYVEYTEKEYMCIDCFNEKLAKRGDIK